MEIKNKLTGSQRGEEGNNGKEGECVQRTHGQGQWGGDCVWEQGLDRAGESNEGKKWRQLQVNNN